RFQERDAIGEIAARRKRARPFGRRAIGDPLADGRRSRGFKPVEADRGARGSVPDQERGADRNWPEPERGERQARASENNLTPHDDACWRSRKARWRSDV